MLRESNQTAEKIIELIQTLSREEQKLIVNELSASGKKQEKSLKPEKEIKKKIDKFQKYVSNHRFDLPKGYKFDREEANTR